MCVSPGEQSKAGSSHGEVCVCVEFHVYVCVLERDKERWRLSCERQLRRKKKWRCEVRRRQQLASEPCRSEATTAARPTPCEVEDGGARWVAVGGAMLPVAGCGVMPLDDGGAKLPQDDGVGMEVARNTRGRSGQLLGGGGRGG